MRPLFRWTIGPVSQDGFEILEESIKLIKNIYNNADYVVCYNGNKPNINVDLIQQQHSPEVEYEPFDTLWKFYPPRLRIESHEIFLDNDIIITEKLKEIDDFFSGNHILLLEGKHRYFGKYEDKVPQRYKINAGLFGFPPGFDFAEKIREICKDEEERKWSCRHDDQGILTLASLNREHIIIPKNTIYNYDMFRNKEFRNAPGIHFIGANRHKHPGWGLYKDRKLKLMV